jgi:hypothetical protein
MTAVVTYGWAMTTVRRLPSAVSASTDSATSGIETR